MQAIADAIVVLWGWRRIAAAFVAGAVSALALPPFDAFPVLWLTLPVFVWLLDGATGPVEGGFLKRLAPAALVGWSFGFGYFLAGLWWIGASFLVDAGRFAFLLPLPVLALPAFLALFWGAGAALARLFWSEDWSRILVLAVAMSTAEWIRGHILTGFPWNAFGYALAPAPLMMQSASVVGLWGLTFVAFIVFASPALLAPGDPRRPRSGWLFVLAALAIFAIHLAFGAARLVTATADSNVPDIRLRIVQPAIEQDEKWQTENADRIFAHNIALSRGPDGKGLDGVTVLIWPETAVPYLLISRPDALSEIGDMLPPGTSLVTGAIRSESPESGETGPRYFNSVEVLDDNGEILAAYDKVDLVPFGEFLPFQSRLESVGLRQLTEVIGGFTAGPRRRTLTLANAPPFGPLVCYEAIFPGDAIEPGNRPGWLLNVTNDAWFGNTPGPRQHFAQARLRAVEEGLPLVRAANSGISAIVDPYGRIVASLALGETGAFDGPLPTRLEPTLYGRFGDWTFVGMMIAAVLVALLRRSTQSAYV